MKPALNLSLYFIADPSCCNGRDVVDVVLAAVRGGATMVQYRDKAGSQDIIRENALRLKTALSGTGAAFLINDYPEIARDIGADGVHIGQGDMSPQAARAIIGEDKILGLTAFTAEHMTAVDPAIVDYVGTGPFYPTLTDKGKPVLGAEKFAAIAALSPVPVVGIGGITADNAHAVLAAGASGVAVMRGISAAPDVLSAALAFYSEDIYIRKSYD